MAAGLAERRELEVVRAENRGEHREKQQRPSMAAARIFSERSSRDKTIHAVSPLAARMRRFNFSTTKQPESTRRFFSFSLLVHASRACYHAR